MNKIEKQIRKEMREYLGMKRLSRKSYEIMSDTLYFSSRRLSLSLKEFVSQLTKQMKKSLRWK